MDRQENCLIITMSCDPEPSQEDLAGAVSFLEGLSFDVQVARIDRRLVLAALGLGHGTMAEIRKNIPGCCVEIGQFSAMDHESFMEAYQFLAVWKLEERSMVA